MCVLSDIQKTPDTLCAEVFSAHWLCLCVYYTVINCSSLVQACFISDWKIWKQKKKIPTHGVQQILKRAVNSASFWLDQRAYSCPFWRLDIIQENQEVYQQYFPSSHFKAQCSSVWIYSRCSHPYIRPGCSLFDLNVCWTLIFLFCQSRYLNLDSCPLNCSMLLPISQLSHLKQDPEPEHPTYECDNHIFPAHYPHPVGPGALHMVCLWGWSVLFGSSRNNATNSKCISLDTVLTSITAK